MNDNQKAKLLCELNISRSMAQSRRIINNGSFEKLINKKLQDTNKQDNNKTN